MSGLALGPCTKGYSFAEFAQWPSSANAQWGRGRILCVAARASFFGGDPFYWYWVHFERENVRTVLLAAPPEYSPEGWDIIRFGEMVCPRPWIGTNRGS